MTAIEKNLIKRVSVPGPRQTKEAITSRAYRGTSTVDNNRKNPRLYDLELIKWDVIFEPLTDDLKEAIATNVTTIVNYDPRIVVNQVTVDSYESGIQIECDLTYLPYNISESMQLRFDQNNSLIS
jgi:hypothetical protein